MTLEQKQKPNVDEEAPANQKQTVNPTHSEQKTPSIEHQKASYLHPS